MAGWKNRGRKKRGEGSKVVRRRMLGYRKVFKEAQQEWREGGQRGKGRGEQIEKGGD